MADAVTYGIEIAVGACCLLASVGAWRRIAWLGVVLAVAGLTAIVHGALALVD